MRSISASLRAGITGATITDAGTPAAHNLPQRIEPARGRRRARLHHARELGIERRHRQRDLDQIALRHAGEDVEVAQDQRRFGHDADRMAVALEHFEDARASPDAARSIG